MIANLIIELIEAQKDLDECRDSHGPDAGYYCQMEFNRLEEAENELVKHFESIVTDIVKRRC